MDSIGRFLMIQSLKWYMKSFVEIGRVCTQNSLYKGEHLKAYNSLLKTTKNIINSFNQPGDAIFVEVVRKYYDDLASKKANGISKEVLRALKGLEL